jgi:hypothetical protein
VVRFGVLATLVHGVTDGNGMKHGVLQKRSILKNIF